MSEVLPAAADGLHAELRALIASSRQRLAGAVNAELTRLYWAVGQRLRTEVLGGADRAKYGDQLINRVGDQLAQEFGRGFEAKNLRRMVQFAQTFPQTEIVATLSRQLSWSHFVNLLPLKTLRRLATVLAVGAAVLSSGSAGAMALASHGNTIILSGPVTGGELTMVKDAFAANPHIDLVVLRNSHGGDAWTGYRVGEFLREAGVTTAVSGYCISSCSRMFLGGKQRVFTNDYPADRSYVGFHGHYNAQGNLDPQSVGKGGLFEWIVKYSDGKADPALVKRWIAIEKNKGAANFFHPDVAAALGHSVFLCDGLQAQKPTSCEALGTNALERGVITDERRIASPDQDALPEKLRARQFPASGYAALDDAQKLPLNAPAGLEQYQRYLQASLPRAFAVAPHRKHWAWVAGADDVNAQALKRCEERAQQACVLYNVDDNVVYK